MKIERQGNGRLVPRPLPQVASSSARRTGAMSQRRAMGLTAIARRLLVVDSGPGVAAFVDIADGHRPAVRVRTGDPAVAGEGQARLVGLIAIEILAVAASADKPVPAVVVV